MYSSVFKRFFDLVLAFVALLFLIPIFIPIILLLLLTGEHRVFYLQERIGLKNKKFKICKFATMLKNSPNMGTGSLTLRNDPRVTWVGRFLRKSKINELPQIFNVINGTMSIIGPRPQMEVDFKAFPEEIQKVIYNEKPGISGIGSIVFRDEEKLMSNTDMEPHSYYRAVIAPYKGALEKWYLSNISFSVDIKLIFLTIWVVISPQSQMCFEILKDLPSLPDALKDQ